MDVETWLDWQASQLSTPCWWWELQAIPGVKDLQKLTHKIWTSFSIPKVRSRTFWGQDFTVPPAPKCLNRNAFLSDGLWCQDVQQQPFLLTLTYARGLQYWVEKLNLPDGSDFCPLTGSVVELKGDGKRTHCVHQLGPSLGFGGVDPKAMSQGSQTSSSSMVMPLLDDKSSKPNPPVRMEGENCYLLVVTASIGQHSLEPSGKGLKGSLTAQCGGDIFTNPQMAAVLSTSMRAVDYGGATIKELKE